MPEDRAPVAGCWLPPSASASRLGNHALTLLLAPGVALFVLAVAAPESCGCSGDWCSSCLAALVVTTVVLYAYIPIRASMHPPLDYAHPTTWASFSYLVFGQQFTGTFHAMPTLSAAVRTVWGVMETNLGIAALGIAGGSRRRPVASTAPDAS